MIESKANLVIKNNFKKHEEEWNVSEVRDQGVKVKRKASSEHKADDIEPLSSTNATVTFSFSSNDIENSTKAATSMAPWPHSCTSMEQLPN